MANGLPPRETKEIVYGLPARVRLFAGADMLYQAVSRVYGPGAGNAVLGLPFGDPTLTRDGVTVAKRVSGPNIGPKDRIAAEGAAVLRQASEKTNKTAGDGTTATIVLAYHLLEAGHRQIMAGRPEEASSTGMRLKRQLEADGRTVVEYLKAQSQEATEQQLLEVATVSSGDENIGRLVADTLKDVGASGGITIREQSYPVIDVERVNGYYFNKGFFALNTMMEWEKPLILVSQKRLAGNTDIVPLIQFVAQSDAKRVVIIGEVSGEALQTLLANTVSNQIQFEAVVIPPPAYNDEAKLFMEDIAIYTGAEVLTDAVDMKKLTPDHFGSADRVQVSGERAILFGGAGDGDQIATRASELQREIEAETEPHRKDQLEGRYSKLVGKIAIVNVGGSTPTEMEELRFRVEDAIEAVKSAMADGVLPGGATMLVRACAAWEQVVGGDSQLFRTALESTFKKLFDNAAEPSEYRLKQVQLAKPGFGFNLRDMTEEPIDLTQAGIWDATRAIVQTIENAVSAAGALLTADVVVEIADVPTEA